MAAPFALAPLPPLLEILVRWLIFCCCCCCNCLPLLLDLFESEKKKDIKPLAPPTSLPINLNPPIFEEPDKVPYSSICPCSAENGGSGICGCTLGNTMVANPKKYVYPKTNWNPYPNLGESDCTNSANTNGSWSINPENLVNHKIGNETGTF